MHSFTVEDLVQYAYQETSKEKSAAIMQALKTDWELNEQYEAIISTQKRLQDQALLSPREEVVDKIILYAGKSVKELTTES